jgi:hypothetical protein
MKSIKSSKLYRREVRALAHLIDRRKLARHLGKVRRSQAGCSLRSLGIDGAFVWGESPQGHGFWAQLHYGKLQYI